MSEKLVVYGPTGYIGNDPPSEEELAAFEQPEIEPYLPPGFEREYAPDKTKQPGEIDPYIPPTETSKPKSDE